MPKVAYNQPPPTKEEADTARVSVKTLFRHAENGLPMQLVGSGTFSLPKKANEKRKPSAGRRTDGSGQAEPVEIPAATVRLLAEILKLTAEGRGVAVIPEDAELTSVQAAEVLNVSRPYLVKLLEEGKIPHRKVGQHRRIRLADVLAYKEAIDSQREAVLDALVADAQEHGMGYGN